MTADSGERTFVGLATRHWSAVHRIALNMLSSASAAHEVTEETFLLALRSAGSLPSDVPVRISLYRLAVGLSLLRTRRTGEAVGESVDDLCPQLDEGPSTDWSTFAETLGQRRDLAERIREGLARVEPVDRASFLLREIEQLPPEEVAAILGASPESVRKGAHRASVRLTASLRQLFRSTHARRMALA